MIRRLRVHGYKSLVDATIELGPLTVIFGPNGAGKSNLLDLVGLLSRLATSETVRQAFDGHRGYAHEAFHSRDGFGPGGLERLRGHDTLSFRVECDLELHPRIVQDVNDGLGRREKIVGAEVAYTRVSETRLRYSVEITLHPQTGELFVRDESLKSLTKDWKPKPESSRKPFIERQDLEDGSSRFIARVERQSHPRYFESHRSRTLLSELSDPVYHPHVVAAARELASWRVYYVEPSLLRGEVPVQAADDPGRRGELLAAFYYGLQQKHDATLRSIERTLHEIVSGIAKIRVQQSEGLLEIVATQENGAEFPARLLSEGTLRLLCLMGVAAAPRPPAVVIYEEPENGVQPARIDLLAHVVRTAVEGRDDGPQFVFTTHSPVVCRLLPDHLVVCRWDRDAGSTFTRVELPLNTLFMEEELTRALDQAGLGDAWNVAEGRD